MRLTKMAHVTSGRDGAQPAKPPVQKPDEKASTQEKVTTNKAPTSSTKTEVAGNRRSDG